MAFRFCQRHARGPLVGIFDEVRPDLLGGFEQNSKIGWRLNSEGVREFSPQRSNAEGVDQLANPPRSEFLCKGFCRTEVSSSQSVWPETSA